MKRFHLIFGLAMFIVFLLTGQYMDKVHNHLQGMDDGLRLLYRSRHIYILMAGLIHIALGLYHETRSGKWQRWVQAAGSLILVTGALLLVAAFIYEPGTRDMETFYTEWGMHVILAGMIFHAISGISGSKNKSGQ